MPLDLGEVGPLAESFLWFYSLRISLLTDAVESENNPIWSDVLNIMDPPSAVVR